MQSIKAFGVRAAGCAAALITLAGCQTGSAFRDPLARMNPDMQAVVVAYQSLGAQPVHTLSVQQARSQPTLMDAAHAVEQAQTGRLQSAYVKTTDMSVPGAAGPLAARLYDPAPGHRGQPIVLYFHGGGGVIGSLDSNDASARALASQAKAMVLSVAYRLAPEAPFPAAQDDGFTAYRWLLDNAGTLGVDRRRIAVAGESVGATIAIDISVAARDARIKLPVHELLIEPVVSPDTQTRSEIANQNTVPFSRADEEWSFRNWVSSPADLADPRIDLLDHADLHGLPTTTIISSEMDPLESDGTTVTQKLQVSGVDVTRIEYQGTANGFFGMGNVVARAKEGEAFAANALDTTFDKIGAPPAPSRASYRPGRGRTVHHHAWHRPKGS
jgi:acetyl esterase